jgi:hypothetical protein
MQLSWLENDYLRLGYPLDSGPELLHLSLGGRDENLLALSPGVRWATPYGEYALRGGHRLWAAPESDGRADIPDRLPLSVRRTEWGVCLSQPQVGVGGLQKELEISLLAGKPAVKIDHRITNRSEQTIPLATWAITMLPLGGRVVLPHPAQLPETDRVGPNRNLVLWPYTSWLDPRLVIAEQAILVEAKASPALLKIGCLNQHGWLAYVKDGRVFRKSFTPGGEGRYPDMGCNVEVYANDRYVELETLGLLSDLAPGECASHYETWEFFDLQKVDPADLFGFEV